MTAINKIELWVDSPITSSETPIDVTEFCYSLPSNKKFAAEIRINDFIFEDPITFTFANWNNEWYSRLGASAYFDTHNTQDDANYKYLSISILRNGVWKRKYAGKIVRHAVESDEGEKVLTVETESPIYNLQDVLLKDVDGVYDGHGFSDPTKTISLKVTELITKIMRQCVGSSISVSFDSYDSYFRTTHNSWEYDLERLWWITPIYRERDVRAETCYTIIKNFCIAHNAICCLEYYDGVPGIYFRAKNRQDAGTDVSTDDLIGEFIIIPNWQDYDRYGVEYKADVTYFDGSTRRVGHRYTADSIAGDTKTRMVSVANTRGGYDVVCNAPIYESTRMKFEAFDDVYTVTDSTTIGALTGTLTLDPPLDTAVYRCEMLYIDNKQQAQTILYPECFHIQLNYPDILMATDTHTAGTQATWKFVNVGPNIEDYERQSSLTKNENVTGIVHLNGLPCYSSYLSGLFGTGMTIAISDDQGQIQHYPEYEVAGSEIVAEIYDSGVATTSTHNLTMGYVKSNDSGDEYKVYCVLAGTWTDVSNPVLHDPRIARWLLTFGTGAADFNQATLTAADTELAKYSGSTTNFGSPATSNFTVWGAFINSDILNPWADNKIYWTDDRSATPSAYRYIKKGVILGTSVVESVYSDTPISLDPRQIHISTTPTGQTILFADNGGYVFRDGRESSNQILGGGAFSFAGASVGDVVYDLDFNLGAVEGVCRSYDGHIIVSDDRALLIVDARPGYADAAWCLDVDGGYQVDCVDFISAWHDEGGTGTLGTTEKYFSIVYNASKESFRFYGEPRRVVSCQMKDPGRDILPLDVLNFTELADFKGMVYEYEFSWEDHSYTFHRLLEYVEYE